MWEGGEVIKLRLRFIRDIVIAAIISVVFVVIQIKASLKSGALSITPGYDDIVYYIDAASRLLAGSYFSYYLAHVPHSPGSTLLAMIGFSLAGVKPTAADAADIIPLFLFIYILLRMFSASHLVVAIIAIAAMLTIPIFGVAIVEFRPDMWSAGLAVLGTLLIVLRDPRQPLIALYSGLIFAAALLMKPTFAPLAVILFGAAFLLRLVPTLRSKEDWKLAAVSLSIIAAPVVVLAAPHFIWNSHDLIDYVTRNIFGDSAALWTPTLSRTETLLYYITGRGGTAILGPWVLISLLALAAIAWLMKLRETICIYVLTLIAYIIVTVPGVKSQYLGMIFNAYLVAMIILAVAAMLPLMRRQWISGIAAALLLVFGVATYDFPWQHLKGTPYPQSLADAHRELNGELLSFLLQDNDIGRKTIAFPIIALYLNRESITFAGLQAGHQLFLVGNFLDGNLSNQLKVVLNSDYVILISSDYSDVLQWIPTTKLYGQIVDALRRDERFHLVKTFAPLPPEVGTISVYTDQ
jgi:hypothetical protein